MGSGHKSNSSRSLAARQSCDGFARFVSGRERLGFGCWRSEGFTADRFHERSVEEGKEEGKESSLRRRRRRRSFGGVDRRRSAAVKRSSVRYDGCAARHERAPEGETTMPYFLHFRFRRIRFAFRASVVIWSCIFEEYSGEYSPWVRWIHGARMWRESASTWRGSIEDWRFYFRSWSWNILDDRFFRSRSAGANVGTCVVDFQLISRSIEEFFQLVQVLALGVFYQ